MQTGNRDLFAAFICAFPDYQRKEKHRLNKKFPHERLQDDLQRFGLI